jgi:hypothetical protein
MTGLWFHGVVTFVFQLQKYSIQCVKSEVAVGLICWQDQKAKFLSLSLPKIFSPFWLKPLGKSA